MSKFGNPLKLVDWRMFGIAGKEEVHLPFRLMVEKGEIDWEGSFFFLVYFRSPLLDLSFICCQCFSYLFRP